MGTLLRVFPLPEAGVSVWCGRGDDAVHAVAADTEHYAASTIKLPILIAAYRLATSGRLDLDQPIKVRADFDSVHTGRFAMDRDYDCDDQPWQRLGERVPMRWLARRMIVSSSNLATNLMIEQTGHDAVAAVTDEVTGVVLRRPISDDAASAAGIQNVATARGLARLFELVPLESAAGELLDVLRAQEYRDGIAAALPADVPVASKGGWVDLLRHDAARIEPPDARPYVLAVCTSGLTDDDAYAAIHRHTEASWRSLGTVSG